jgi:hypothetical protein
MPLNTSGAVVIEPAPLATSFGSALVLTDWRITGNPSSVRIGSTTNTAAINLYGFINSITAAGPISFYGGALDLRSPITATNSTITLQGTSTSVSGAVNAANLVLSGGSASLTSTSNNVGTLAASGLSSLSYTDSNALTIGTVGATSGIGATGTVSVSTLTGDLNLAGNINTTSTSSSAILLNAGKNSAPGTASGGNLLISGTPTLSVGTGGRISLMTGSVTGSTGLTSLSGLTAGTGRFRYNADETTSFSSAPWTNLGSGVYGIYRERPTATPDNLNQVITYGDSFALSTSASGLVNGDTLSQTITSAVYSSGRLNANATPYTITNNLTGLGYSVSANTLTVNPKALTASGLSSANKVYNGTTTAVVSGTAALQAAVATGTSSDGKPLTGDDVGLTGTAVGNFNTKDVLTANTVAYTGLSLTGAQASNYSLTQHANATTPRITRLSSVTWVGGTTGNWLDPANWAGGAVPDLANVANVVIPSGVTVSFGSTVVAPAQSGAVSIDGLTGAGGNLSQSAGTLNVGAGGITLGSLTQSAGTMANTGSTALDSFTQSGGGFTGTANMTTASFAQTGGSTTLLANLSVTQDFSQGSSGNVSVGGNATITDSAGGLQLGNLTSTGTLSVSSTDGAVTQVSSTAFTAQSTSSFTATQSGQPAAITLGNAGNDFVGAVGLSGSNVSIVDVNALTLGTVNTAGNLTLNSNGALNLGTSTVGGNLVANSGNGNNTQTGALSVVGTTGLSAGTGSITLNSVNNNFGGVVTTVGNTISIQGTNAPAPNAPPPSPPPPPNNQGPVVDPAAEAAALAAAEKAAAEKLEQERLRAGNVNSVTDSLLSQVASSTQFSRVNLPNPTSSAPLVLGGATASITSGGSAAAGGTVAASGTANSSGVTVDVKGSQQQDVRTMVAVSLPKGASTMGTGFSFVLPDSVRATAGEGVSVQATRVDGSALPAWLKFDRANLRFEATAVPDGAFPMQLALSIGGQRLLLVISERTD